MVLFKEPPWMRKISTVLSMVFRPCSGIIRLQFSLSRGLIIASGSIQYFPLLPPILALHSSPVHASLKHTQGDPYGENVYGIWTSRPIFDYYSQTATGIRNGWYNEIFFDEYKNPVSQPPPAISNRLFGRIRIG